MSKRLDFETLRNSRDLGGMRSKDGRVVAEGRLIRSGHLVDLSPGDREKLTALVDVIVDFRTDGEHIEKPDDVIEGAVCHHIPIINSWTPGITREEEMQAAAQGRNLSREVYERLILQPTEAKQYMCDMYRRFVESDFSTGQYGKFVKILLMPHEKAVLWHCTAGKDRAGMASVIVEELLGIPREEVIKDYLQTNEYLEEDIRSLTVFMKRQYGIEADNTDADQSLRYLFGAERDFIVSFYEAAEGRHGDFDTFLRDGLGITDQEKKELQERYLTAG